MDNKDSVLTAEIVAEIEAQSINTIVDAERRSVILMLELAKSRADLFLLMRDDTIANWWAGKIAAAREAIEKRRQRWVIYRHKIAVWDRLTAAERRALGLRKPVAPNFPEPGRTEA